MNQPQVIYEEKEFIIVNKPAGWLTHDLGLKIKDLRGDVLTEWLLKKYPELKKVGDDPEQRPGIVHRLDKDTSGVLLVCRMQAAFDYFKRQFQEHKMKKTYLALIHGAPKERQGEIRAPIGLKPDTTRRTTHVKNAKMVKEAVTRYRVKSIYWGETSIDEYTLLEVKPLTGRTHQIRVHLASIGHPVVGDRLYGLKIKDYRLKTAAGPMLLHAESLEFTTPDGRRLKIAADLPADFTQALAKLQPAPAD